MKTVTRLLDLSDPRRDIGLVLKLVEHGVWIAGLTRRCGPDGGRSAQVNHSWTCEPGLGRKEAVVARFVAHKVRMK